MPSTTLDAFKACLQRARLRPVAGTALVVVLPLLLLAGCGSSTPPPIPDEVIDKNADGGTAASDAATEGSAASVCTGSDLDLLNALIQGACEVPTRRPTSSAAT